MQAVVFLHIACNNLWTVFNTNVFIYFDEVLGASLYHLISAIGILTNILVCFGARM